MSKRITVVGVAGLSAALALVVVALILFAHTPEKSVAQAQAVSGQAQAGTGGVSVQGTGAVLVKPDVVKLGVGVESRGSDVSSTQNDVAQKIAAITDAAKALGVKPEDIATANYNIQPNYIYNNNQPPQLNGYIVRNQLSVTVRDLSKAGPIIDAVGKAGANLVSGINFTLDDNTEAVKQARAAAVADAKAKADQLAALGGFQLGNVFSISEAGGNQPPAVVYSGPATAAAPGASQASTIIEGGQFRISVNVQVVYSIK